MESTLGLRDRKKLEMRHRLGDVAARLFAAKGYDAVSMSDVARAADVSEQTVYNYFSSKPELVLDRDEEIRLRLGQVVRDRPAGSSPADALQPIVGEDIDRFVDADGSIAKGEFPAQSLESPVLRRFALESRDRQAETIASAILETNPDLNAVIVRAHAAALVAVIQAITDRIGRAIIDDASRAEVASTLRDDATAALGNLRDHFATLSGRKPRPSRRTKR
jgi:AcrR family transcriptional regulator